MINLRGMHVALLGLIVSWAAFTVGCSKEEAPNGTGITPVVEPITMTAEAVTEVNRFAAKNNLDWTETVFQIREKDAPSPTSPLALGFAPRTDIDSGRYREYKVKGVPIMIESKILKRVGGIDIHYEIQNGKPGFRLDFRPL